MRKELEDLVMSTDKDMNRISSLMAATYSARRQIILNCALVADLLKQWPALFLKSQVLVLKM
jgi:hypothetical protein